MISEGEEIRQIHRSSSLQQVFETILQRGMILPTRISRSCWQSCIYTSADLILRAFNEDNQEGPGIVLQI